MIIITRKAYAKINLGLRILSRRDDGYHNIETHFQRISLHDTVAIFPKESGVGYFGPKLTESPEHNLSVKAAVDFLRIFNIKGGVEVALSKRIPTGAGLGGGSSDAATVLMILAEIFDIEPTDKLLLELAASLGADVSFFMKDLPSAAGSGLGEQLQPIEGLPSNKTVLIIWPGFQVSTAQAYREFDNALTEPLRITNLGVRLHNDVSTSGSKHYNNDFESIVFSAHPTLLEARDRLLQAGAESAGLTGSGSSLFAIFDGESKARAAANIHHPPWQSFICRPC